MTHSGLIARALDWQEPCEAVCKSVSQGIKAIKAVRSALLAEGGISAETVAFQLVKRGHCWLVITNQHRDKNRLFRDLTALRCRDCLRRPSCVNPP